MKVGILGSGEVAKVLAQGFLVLAEAFTDLAQTLPRLGGVGANRREGPERAPGRGEVVGINAAVVSRDKVIPDIASFARAAVYGNPLIDQVRTRGGVEPELIVDALAQDFRREFGADPGRRR